MQESGAADRPGESAMTSATVLETERLHLRRLEMRDAQTIFQLLNEPGWIRYIGDKGVRSVKDAQAYLRDGPLRSYRMNGFGLYLVEKRESAIPVGVCGLIKRDSLPDVDIGYAIFQAHWGQGYATESATAVLHYGRQKLGIERIVAIVSQDNQASIGVLQKIGLHFEKIIRLQDEDEDIKLFATELHA